CWPRRQGRARAPRERGPGTARRARAPREGGPGTAKRARAPRNGGPEAARARPAGPSGDAAALLRAHHLGCAVVVREPRPRVEPVIPVMAAGADVRALADGDAEIGERADPAAERRNGHVEPLAVVAAEGRAPDRPGELLPDRRDVPLALGVEVDGGLAVLRLAVEGDDVGLLRLVHASAVVAGRARQADGGYARAEHGLAPAHLRRLEDRAGEVLERGVAHLARRYRSGPHGAVVVEVDHDVGRRLRALRRVRRGPAVV